MDTHKFSNYFRFQVFDDNWMYSKNEELFYHYLELIKLSNLYEIVEDVKPIPEKVKKPIVNNRILDLVRKVEKNKGRLIIIPSENRVVEISKKKKRTYPLYREDTSTITGLKGNVISSGFIPESEPTSSKYKKLEERINSYIPFYPYILDTDKEYFFTFLKYRGKEFKVLSFENKIVAYRLKDGYNIPYLIFDSRSMSILWNWSKQENEIISCYQFQF
jgi:hypothetical protein